MMLKFKKFLLAFPGFQALCRLLTRGHVRAVMYHRFSAEFRNDPRFVNRDSLIRQARYFCRHHTIWTPDQHLQAVRGQKKVTGAPIVVTVDDGYADFHQVAFPVFKEYSIPAMLFVSTGFVDGLTWFWWDKLAQVLESAPAGNFRWSLKGEPTSFVLDAPASRHAAWHVVADQCRFLPDQEKNKVIEELSVKLNAPLTQAAPSGRDPVTWDQVRTMHKEGMLFGAHTVNHPILSRVSLESAEHEIVESGQRLKTELDQEIDWFCYPQGGPADYTPEVRQIVADHYQGCYLAYPEVEDFQDPFTMPRYCLSPDWDAFRWAMCGAEYLVFRLKKKLGMSTGVADSYWAGNKEDEEES